YPKTSYSQARFRNIKLTFVQHTASLNALPGFYETKYAIQLMDKIY
ncbi:unnamed protein product, partial [Gulo gulo]